MSTDLILKARARIRHHEAEIARLRDFIATAESLVSEDTPTISMTDATRSVAVPSLPASYANLGGVSSTQIVLQEAADVLRREEKPLAAADIYERVIRRGVKISGKNPKGNLTAKFATRKDIFFYDKNAGLWSLAEWSRGRKDKAPTGEPEGAS